VNDAIAALLAKPGRAKRVLVAQSAAASPHVHWPGHVAVADRDLAKTIRDRKTPAAVVVVSKLNATLIRALRTSPPALVVITGEAADGDVQKLTEVGGDDPVRVLGPHAGIRVGDGPTVLCATNALELERLHEACGAARLAVAPTPAWLSEWLSAPPLAGCSVVGFVSVGALHVGWVDWIRGSQGEHVLVPLGVSEMSVEQPLDEGAEAIATAHVLERLTGPLFPAPRVLSAVARGLRGVGAETSESIDLDLWQQARRALPGAGSWLGMEVPDASTPDAVATAAFLAQRSLLYAKRARELLDGGVEAVADGDEQAQERATEVLAASGEVLSEHESKVVLRGFGVEITRQAVANSASGAAQYGERIGFPVVLKAVSPDLRRKAEVGAVMLGLQNAAAVRRGYAEIVQNVRTQAPTARVDGVAVAEQVDEGLEIRCGGMRLRSGRFAFFGHPASLSTGVEPAMSVGPLNPSDALLLAHAILSRIPVPGLRRASDPHPAVLAELFIRLSAMVETTGDRLLSIDINPIRLLAGERPYVVLDARITQRPHLEGR
jgi:acetyltransferase